MKKLGLLKSEKMGNYEKEQGYASYRAIVERFIGDIVLCNNIADIDQSIFDNMENDIEYIDEEGNYRTHEEYINDNEGKIEAEHVEIYQYFLCNLSTYEKELCLSAGLIISYSDMLECDVLCVNHFGTSWDYVLTDVPLFDTYEELKAYEEN